MKRITSVLVVLSLLALALGEIGCQRRTSRRATTERFSDTPVIPIARAERQMSGRITYRLSSLVQKTDDQVYADIEIMNGVARGFRSCSVIVTFIGRDGAKKRVRWNLGPLYESETERVTVKTSVDFKVEDLQVAVQTTM
jgi:hypothetical protein